jgi:hypothetical protein
VRGDLRRASGNTGAGAVTTFIKMFAAALAGACIGLITVDLTIGRDAGFGSAVAGPWTAWLKRGALDPDPYTRAAVARFGEIPLGPSEGLSFVAGVDSGGAKLDSACDYRISGKPLTARFWTLSLLNDAGAPSSAPDARAVFSSQEVLRGEDGAFEIVASARARPGNWLNAEGAGHFLLMLNLYDTSIGATATAVAAAGLPRIEKGACR